MKNGRALKGHRRITAALGIRPSTRNKPVAEGWTVSCICGWEGGKWPNSSSARLAYKKHIDYQIDQCPFKCKRCGAEKPLSQMSIYNRYICSDCSSIMGNEWQKKHPIEAAEHKRNHSLLKRVGITLKEADEILSRQGFRCAICQEIIPKRKYAAHVDHDHITGRIRGILCFNCNVGLGSFRDDPIRLQAAIEYLRRKECEL